jgi:hypothetical protein
VAERVARGVRALTAALFEQRARSNIVGRDALAVAIQLAEPVARLTQAQIAGSRIQRSGALEMSLPLLV